jgi:hypothetical protein
MQLMTPHIQAAGAQRMRVSSHQKPNEKSNSKELHMHASTEQKPACNIKQTVQSGKNHSADHPGHAEQKDHQVPRSISAATPWPRRPPCTAAATEWQLAWKNSLKAYSS